MEYCGCVFTLSYLNNYYLKMYTLLNYLKNYETKITEGEIPEKPFLDTTNYNVENFNLNSFTKTIMEKIHDSNFLIKKMTEIIDNIKEDIVLQINSNFNNYISLIAKLQALDFLIENIQKPLDNINDRITSELSYIERYESELVSLSKFVRNNDMNVDLIKQSLGFLKNYERCKAVLTELHQRYEKDSTIVNIINGHPEDNFINSYDLLRKFLFDLLRFIDKVNLLKKTEINDQVYHKMITEVKDEEDKYFLYIEELLRILLNEGGTKNVVLIKNLMILTIKCYLESNREKVLNHKVNEIAISKLIDSCFDSGSVQSRLDDFSNLIAEKLSLYTTCLKFASKDNPKTVSHFNLTCIILPVIERLGNDKYIFNCVDYNIFRETLNSILNFITKYSVEADAVQLAKVRSFISHFSFFTYFQFLQNDMCKVFIEDGMNNFENLDSEDNLDNFITKRLMIMSNLNFNVIRMLEEVFRDRKLFVKILPNFFIFLMQINKFFIAKQLDAVRSENMVNIITLVSQEGFSFEESNMMELKRNLFDYVSNLDSYLNFFVELFPDKIRIIVNRDLFLFQEENLQGHIDEIASGLILMIKSLTQSDEIVKLVELLDLRSLMNLKVI
jgi:hypothetical protein